MGSDSFKRRLSPKPPAGKCKQCGVELAKPERTDGLGKNCGIHKDKAAEKMANWKETHK